MVGVKVNNEILEINDCGKRGINKKIGIRYRPTILTETWINPEVGGDEFVSKVNPQHHAVPRGEDHQRVVDAIRHPILRTATKFLNTLLRNTSLCS